MQTIYFIIFILFTTYIVFTWRSTKEFENIRTRFSYIFVGTLFITLLTFIIFLISKIGVQYPREEMVGEIRKIILLVFVPINGFIVLTQFAGIVTSAKSGTASKEDMKRKIKIFIIICISLIIVECIYFKSIQTGMIDMIEKRIEK